MSITTNQQLYDSIKILSQNLRAAGYDKAASALDDAMSISTLPGEILAELRFELQNLRSSRAAVQLNLRRLVDDALNYLDSILDT